MKIKQLHDPYLRKRVSLPNDPNSPRIGGLVFGLIIIGVLFGAGWYSVPQFFQNTPTAPMSADNSPVASTKIAVPLPNVVVSSPVVTESVAEKPTVEKPVEIDTTTEKPIVPAEMAIQPASDPAPPAVETVPPPVVETIPEVVVAEVQETQPVTTAVSTSTENVENLVAKAQGQIAKKRFTSPPGDNAYETYQVLAKVSPELAQMLLETIISWYLDQGRELLNDNKVVQPERNNAYKIYQKMHEIAPDHQNTQLLLKEVLEAQHKRLVQQLQKGNILEPVGNNTYESIQDLLVIAPNSAITKRFLDKVVKQLFNEAEGQLIKQNYLSPPQKNAYLIYQKILKISPDNPKVQQKINFMVAQYYQKANVKFKQKNYAMSLEFIDKGLQLNPQHEGLLKLKEQIATAQNH